MKAVAFDIISYFHVMGCLSFFLKNVEIQELIVYIIPNLRGEYAVEEKDLLIDGRPVKFIKQRGIGYPSIISVSLMLLGRFGSSKPKYFLLHHSYFKPTGLSFFEKFDCMSVRCITIEEGTGSYASLWSHIMSSRRERKSFPIIKYVLRRILKLFCSDHVTVLGESDSYNAEFIRSIQLIENIFFHDEISAAKNQIGNDAHALIIGAPWDLHGCKPSAVIKKIREIELAEGMKAILKPHPLDNNTQHYIDEGIKVLSHSVPAELFITRIIPSVIYSDGSGIEVFANKYTTIQQKKLELLGENNY